MNRIWLITGLLALMMVGGAVFMTLSRPDVSPSATAESGPLRPRTAIRETDRKVPPMPSSAGAVSGSRDLGNDEWGRPLLQLDRIAGTLKASIPVLTMREQRLPLEYSCFRRHISPPVKWEGSPRDTKSFVIFMERRGAGVAPHLIWALYNVPATYTGLEQGLPKILEPGDNMRHARGDPDAAEYVGPCESKGRIPYVLRVFALDAILALPAGMHNHDLMRAMNGHIIDMAEVPFIHYLRF